MGGSASRTAAQWPAGVFPENVARLTSALVRGGRIEAGTTSAEAITAVLDEQVRTLLAYSKSVKAAASATSNCSNRQPGAGAAAAAALPPPPFQLMRAPSTVAIGEGVFAVGDIAPGTAVAFFPGMCFPAPPSSHTLEMLIPAWRGMEQSWEENDKVIARYDGSRVDGLAWEKRHNHAADGGAEEGMELLHDNGYAVGHMLNHPAPDAHPNVMHWGVDLNADTLLEEHGIERELLPYAMYPNWYYSSEWNEMVSTPAHYPLGAVVRQTPPPSSLRFFLLTREH